jgi:hypothetical protein
MWPEDTPSSSQPTEEWLQTWRRGFDGVDGLCVTRSFICNPVLIRDTHSDNLLDTLLPEYTFAPRVPFATSAIANEMTKSLRLTRHSAVTRLSPMTHFMRNKGLSSDWEKAVKNRSDEIPDDMPVGWRIVEKKEDAPTPVETKKKSGIFSSFWNRREGSTTSIPDVKTSLVPDSPAEPSPTKPASIAERVVTPPMVPSRTGSQSPGKSAEGRRSQSASSSRLTKPPPPPPVVAASVSASSATTVPPVSLIGQSPADVVTSPVESTASADGPPQSAVSRFLGRFSRPKSTASHNSLSLSSEDLDFLSDAPVVQSANDAGDEDDDVPLGKQKAIMESRQGAMLATPLTATPPRAGTPPHQAVVEDDFDALFNTPIVKPQRTPLQTPTRTSSSGSQRGPLHSHSAVSRTDSPMPPNNSLRPQTPSFPIVRMSPAPSLSSSGAIPFLIPPPPPPTSRPTTPGPLVRTLSPPATTSLPLLQPPPPSKKPPKTDVFSDDDDFSDFLSSQNQGLPVINGTNQRKKLSFSGVIEPVSSSSSLNPITPSTSQQPILRTTSGPGSSAVSPVSDVVEDAWDFYSFEDSAPAASTTANSTRAPSPPTKIAANHLSAPQRWLSKPSPPPPPVPSKSGSSTPSSLTNSPLGPPPKSHPLPKQRPPPFNLPGSDQQRPPHSRSHTRRVSAEEHSHTLQLMNNASKRGAWPAPLSPLPEVLAPPPPPSSRINGSITASSISKTLLDLGEEDGAFARAQGKHQQPKAVSVIGPSEDGGGMRFSNVGSPESGGLFALPPPPGSVPRHNLAPPQPEQERSLLDFGDFESPKTAPSRKPTPAIADKSKGGLSAQDLSFFEGL